MRGENNQAKARRATLGNAHKLSLDKDIDMGRASSKILKPNPTGPQAQLGLEYLIQGTTLCLDGLGSLGHLQPKHQSPICCKIRLQPMRYMLR